MPTNIIRYYKTTKEPDIFTRIVGNKIYEINDHLGNVRATVSDRRMGGDAEISSYTNYYPFDMEIANRTFSNNYKFGFNGQEIDKEAEIISFKFRPYDRRTGRFLGVDPLSREYPWNSCYAFAENRVIDGKDLEGKEYFYSAGSGNLLGVLDPNQKEAYMVLTPTTAKSVKNILTENNSQAFHNLTALVVTEQWKFISLPS